MSRFILRFSGAAMAPENLAATLSSQKSIKVLDSTAKMLLIDGRRSDIESALTTCSGWTLTPETFTPLPDGKVKAKPG